MPEYGISGSSSGLGAGLKRIFGGEPLDRANLGKYKHTHFNTIIHAGFERFDKSKNHKNYQKDAVQLAKTLLKLNYDRFIFISTVECNDPYLRTPYVETKKEIERLVQSECNIYQILRLPSLYGLEMKLNQIYRIATENNPTLTLSKDSSFSLISYEDVAEFISQEGASCEICSLMSESLSLDHIANYFSTKPTWGSYKYETRIPTGIQTIYSKLQSLERFQKFIRDINA